MTIKDLFNIPKLPKGSAFYVLLTIPFFVWAAFVFDKTIIPTEIKSVLALVFLCKMFAYSTIWFISVFVLYAIVMKGKNDMSDVKGIKTSSAFILSSCLLVVLINIVKLLCFDSICSFISYWSHFSHFTHFSYAMTVACIVLIIVSLGFIVRNNIKEKKLKDIKNLKEHIKALTFELEKRNKELQELEKK